MTNPPDLEALRYLLNEMDEESRAAFEERMEVDPLLQQTVHDTAEALGTFATSTAPAEPMAAADQEAAFQRVVDVAAADARKRRLMVWSRRWAWPLAASLLLGLNLWQFWGTEKPPQHQPAPAKPGTIAFTSPETGETLGGSTLVSLEQADPQEGDIVASAELAEHSPQVESVDFAELQRLREIRSAYEQLARENDRLQDEHTEILRQLATYALTEQGVNRLAAMELVDPASYASGERRGLFELALNLLAEPGIIALDPAVASGAGQGQGEGANVAAPAESGSVADPYAWSIFDESLDRGFLNLYNLPVPAEGNSFQLWVRPASGGSYTRVGEVPPQMHGGSGSLSYSFPGGDQPPAEILITTEPIDVIPDQPEGTPILRGP